MANLESEFSRLNKTLGDKMRSSANDYHYASKYWVRFTPYDAIKSIDAPRDNTFFGNAMTRLLLLPIWLPYWYWNKQKNTREMKEFIVAGTSGRVADDELRRQLALKWVELHPGDFVFGEYDPKLPQLEATFQRIFNETLGLKPSAQVRGYIETGARAASIQRAGYETGRFNLSVLPHILRIVGIVLAGLATILAVVFLWLWMLS